MTYPKHHDRASQTPDDATPTSHADVEAADAADATTGARSGGVPASPNFPAIEERVLADWKAGDTFRRSIANRDGAEEWVFYDGPPFANGLPHYGHLLTGYAKDVFPRFQTMVGKKVPRRFGWDTHGLPAELETMKQLGINTKAEIEEMGIATFNAEAKAGVLKYANEWRDYVTRQARWVDLDDDYKTFDIDYMESVIWAFKQLYEKGYAYESYRVLPYCWRDETPLSAHELRMDDDVYRMRQDQTLTVRFTLRGARADALELSGIDAVAWTTTPWTLPTNLALAVGAEITYVVVPLADGTGRILIARDLAGGYAKDLGYASAADVLDAIEREVNGADLADVEYEPLFDYLADAETWGTERAFRILIADFVSTGDGTGIVHIAPAYGEDDQVVAEAAGVPTILSVDDGGKFLTHFAPYSGLQVFDSNRPISQDLKAAGKVLRQASYEHSYPHCWRCGNPLIYKAVSSWFVRVSDHRDELLQHNEAINWIPENVKHGQFGKWLEGARDWSVSRNRYWGTPIPVWKSDDPNYPRIDVYGSLDELERDFGVRPADLHRPFIDELTRPNPNDPTGRSTMRRITDIFDVWFDSGSMPYAQVHYPFENEQWFESHAPADYIVEYIGQTRGWFYVMHVLSTLLFGRNAFTNVMSHGIILGNDGFKASKSRRNYPDVYESFNTYGSDAVRWMLMSGSILRGGNLAVTEEGFKEALRSFHLPLWSTYYFFTLYSNTAAEGGYDAVWRADSSDPLDRYILSKTGALVREVRELMEAFDATGATLAIRDFVDTLTNWYVRRSRDRFWIGVTEDEGSRDAFDTLYTVLETLTRVAAPLAPMVTEEVWRGLTGGDSVHLADYPDGSVFPVDAEIEQSMDLLRLVATASLSVRKARGLRVRLPLANLTVVTPGAERLQKYESILRDELNVKDVALVEMQASSGADFGVSERLQVNARAAGPRLGKTVQQAIKAAREGDFTHDGARVVAGGIALEPGEYEFVLEVADAGDRAVSLLSGGGFVVLDATLTAELEAEGLARDTIRAVQDERRSAGLEVSDRIHLVIGGDANSIAALEKFRALVSGETLAEEFDLVVEEDLPPAGVQKVGSNGTVRIGVAKW